MAKKTNRVNKTKSNLTWILILIVAIAALAVLSSATKETSEDIQKQLVSEAEEFMQDKLYKRATDNYEEAITKYSTNKNIEYETRLLEIYKEAGFLDEYYGLIKKRIKEDRATNQEYYDYSSFLLEASSGRTVIKTLKDKLEDLNDPLITEIYEAAKYKITSRYLESAQYLQPNDNWLIPSYNGEKWGYLSEDNKVAIDFNYDFATPFSGDYAIVLLDSVYTRIDQKGNRLAIDKDGLESVESICDNYIVGVKEGKKYIYNLEFKKKSEGYDEIVLSEAGAPAVKSEGTWKLLDSSLKEIKDVSFTDIKLNSKGQLFSNKRAVAKDASGWVVIKSAGTPCFENRFMDAKGAEGGLVAVSDDGKNWGFIDNTGEYVISPQYADAYSFSSDLGLVRYAGEWQYINRFNKVMIDATFEEALPFVSDKALVVSGDETNIIKLSYYNDYSSKEEE